MALVAVASFAMGYEADLAQELLLSEGIEAVLFDREMGWSGLGMMIPVRLMVHAEESHAATAVLAALP